MSLNINLLGGINFLVDGEAIPPLRSRSATALLVYLASNRQSFSRDYLATFFWPDKTQTQATANLRSTIRILKSHFQPYLTITRREIAFNDAADYQIDVSELEKKLDQLTTSSAIPKTLSPQLRETLLPLLATDQSVFMPGFYLTNSPKFEQWMAHAQDRLKQKIKLGIQKLVKAWLIAGKYQTALPFAERLAELDPYDESVQRMVMEILWRSGQKSEALLKYKALAALLAQDLDVLPSEETILLRSRIRAHRPLPPTHLPLQTTPFIGRDQELIALYDQLMEPTCHLLTIFGPGGVGKTRLLIALGEMLCRHFPGPYPDGIFYIPLVQLSSARYLTTALLTNLGLTVSGEMSPKEQLIAHVQGKEMVLLLDNMEHLLTDSADGEIGIELLEMLIHSSRNLKIVTTSRSKISLTEEWVYGLEGLRLPPESWHTKIEPEGNERADAESMRLAAIYPATNFFIQTGRRMNHQFQPALNDVLLIGQICRHLDGFPLGIEMASALLDHLSPKQIEHQILTEASELVSTLRNIPDRHRSLWGVFAYSYRQLDEPAQACFCQLAVFNSPFDHQTAKDVTGATSEILSGLVNQSLIKEMPSSDGNKIYFEMHRLLRQFATEQLEQNSKLERAAKGRHTKFFINFLFERVEPIRQGGPPSTLHLVESFIDDIRSVWQRLIPKSILPKTDETADDELFQFSQQYGEEKVERALEAILTFYFGKGWVEEGLELAERASSILPRSEISIRGELWAAEFKAGLGEYNDADDLFQVVLNHSRQLGSKLIEMEAINGLGRVKYYKGDMDSAEQLFHTGLSLAYQEEDAVSISLALNCLANTVAASHMAYEKTISLLSEALEISNSAGDQFGAARALINLGTVAQEQNRLEEAKNLYQQSLVLYQTIGYQHGIASAFNYLGQIATISEDFDSAQALLQDSLELHLANGDRRGEADCLCQMGNIARSQRQDKVALNYYGEAAAIMQAMGGDLLSLTILYEIAELHRLEGRLETATKVAGHLLSHPAVGDEIAASARNLLANLGSEADEIDTRNSLTLGQMLEIALAE